MVDCFAQSFYEADHHKTLRCKLLLAQMLDANNEYAEASQLASEAARAHTIIADRAEQSLSKQEPSPEPEPQPEGDILVSVGSKVATDEHPDCAVPDCAVLETRGTGEAKISWKQVFGGGLVCWETDAGTAGWIGVHGLRTKNGGHRCTAAVTTIHKAADSLPDTNCESGCQYWDLEGQRWARIPARTTADVFWDPVCQF